MSNPKDILTQFGYAFSGPFILPRFGEGGPSIWSGKNKLFFFTDLERTTKLILRVLFYASPIIYSVSDLPGAFAQLAAFNPLSGIFTLYRMGFFPEVWNTLSVALGAVMSVGFLALGVFVFRRLERPVLKEL